MFVASHFKTLYQSVDPCHVNFTGFLSTSETHTHSWQLFTRLEQSASPCHAMPHGPSLLCRHCCHFAVICGPTLLVAKDGNQHSMAGHVMQP